MRKFGLLGVVLVLVFVVFSGNAFAQDEENTGGFYRIGLGTVDFEHETDIYDPAYRGHLHYHQAGITANFALGYGTDKLRALVFFDPAIVDGVQGASIISVGAKGEVGVPWLKWLKLGGGVMYSHNHAKLSDDVKIYERAGLDTGWWPFASVTFLPRAEGPSRFFADIPVGRAIGGDVIQPQTGKPVASMYVSVSLGAHVRFRR